MKVPSAARALARGGLYGLALALASACGEEPKLIDPFPILIDTSSGPVLLAAAANRGAPVEVTLDTLSPITVFDGLGGEPAPEVPIRRRVELTLFGLGAGRTPTVPRVRFPDTPAFDLHPCDGDLCRVGDPDDPVVVRGIIGADVLSRSSVRLDFSAGTLRFFPDAAGSAEDRTDACEAVWGDPFHGGGALLIGNDEVDVAGWRPTLRACLDQADPPEDQVRGVDSVVVLSTGLGTSLLSASAYDRYAAATGATPRDQLPAGETLAAAGPIRGAVAQIGHYTLTGEVGDDSRQRGACRELHANRLLAQNACQDPDLPFPEGGCPCPENETFCQVAAAVEIARPLDVLVVADSHPILQGLRDELRPGVAEVDAVLGVDALRQIRVELDYPNDRILAVCTGPDCTVHPAVRSEQELDELAMCRARAEADAGPADAGSPDAAPADAAPVDAGADDGGPVE